MQVVDANPQSVEWQVVNLHFSYLIHFNRIVHSPAIEVSPFPGKLHNNGWSLASIWVNYNELTTSSLEIMVSKGKYPQMALIQISELL